MKKIGVLLCIVVMLISGCNSAKKDIERQIPNESTNNSVVPQSINEVDLFPLYYSGLDSKEMDIQWYSVYKMIDFYDSMNVARNRETKGV